MNSDTKALFGRTLKQAGYSMTIPRKIVFELLWGQEPLTMRELTAKVADNIDRASLYRTTKLFEQLDIIQRVHIGWKYKLELSEKFSTHHHHLVCTSCGQLVDIVETPELEAGINKLATSAGFRPQNHSLEIQGICPRCQKNA